MLRKVLAEDPENAELSAPRRASRRRASRVQRRADAADAAEGALNELSELFRRNTRTGLTTSRSSPKAARCRKSLRR